MGSRSPEQPNVSSTAPYYNQALRGSYQNGYDAPDDYGIAQQIAPQAPMYNGPPQDTNALDDYSEQAEQSSESANSTLAGLLRALASTREDAADATRRATRSMGLAEQPLADDNYAQESPGKRKRNSGTDYDAGDDEDGGNFSTGDVNTTSRKRARHKSSSNADGNHPNGSAGSQYPYSALTDARAAGVHSAAALFRRPSASTAKKYTRPPMSKLYASLNLSPENFLHLQAAAKSYMLDPNYPERQDCVGNRGKGDTDMTKLKLFNCVRDFLSEGIGERYFSESAENNGAGGDGAGFGEGAAPTQKWVWPRDGNKIISLVTPLLRRMVTNERQRQYAIETRKGGGPKRTKKSNDAGQDTSMLDADSSGMEAPSGEWAPPNDVPSHTAVLDPALNPHYNLSAVQETPHPSYGENVIQIFLLRDGIKLLPRIDLPSHTNSPAHTLPLAELHHIIALHLHGLPRLLLTLNDREASVPAGSAGVVDATTQLARDATNAAALAAAAAEAVAVDDAAVAANGESEVVGEGKSVHNALGEGEGAKGVFIQALTARGMVDVRSEEDWEGVKAEVAATPFLEGMLRVVVEVGV